MWGNSHFPPECHQMNWTRISWGDCRQSMQSSITPFFLCPRFLFEKCCPKKNLVRSESRAKWTRLRALKGQCHKIFRFRFFSWITFPQAPDNNIRIFSNFFENSRRYSQVKVHHRCQRHRWQIWHRCQRRRWQIIRTISGCRHLKVNLKAKIYIYVSSTTQRRPN